MISSIVGTDATSVLVWLILDVVVLVVEVKARSLPRPCHPIDSDASCTILVLCDGSWHSRKHGAFAVAVDSASLVVADAVLRDYTIIP